VVKVPRLGILSRLSLTGGGMRMRMRATEREHIGAARAAVQEAESSGSDLKGEIRAHEYYEKPCEARRRKEARRGTRFRRRHSASRQRRNVLNNPSRRATFERDGRRRTRKRTRAGNQSDPFAFSHCLLLSWSRRLTAPATSSLPSRVPHGGWLVKCCCKWEISIRGSCQEKR